MSLEEDASGEVDRNVTCADKLTSLGNQGCWRERTIRSL